MKKVNVISLGCSKNLVDTELLMRQLEKAGYVVELDGENSEAKIVVVNTCGFIGDAKEESVNTILEQVERKSRGEVDKIFVMGCLSQRYGEELRREIPEVDAYFGKFDWQGILSRLDKKYDEECRHEFDPTNLKVLLTLAVATSIDALAIGISFAFLGTYSFTTILPPVGIIGLVSFILSLVGLMFGICFGNGIARKLRAELWGGIILIAIGTKILIEHIFFS